jgi:hypothetical protein
MKAGNELGATVLCLVGLGCGALEEGPLTQSGSAEVQAARIVVPGAAEENLLPSDVAVAPAAVERFSWDQKPGGAKDIAISGGSWYGITAEWVIGTPPVNGGHRLYKFDGVNDTWIPSNGGALRGIAVEFGTQKVWVVNDKGEIFYKTDPGALGTWHLYRPLKCANDIAATSSTAWALGCTVTGTTGQNYEIWQLGPAAAIRDVTGGGAARIALCEVPWIVTASGTVYSRSNNSAQSGVWNRRSNSKKARDISCGYQGAWITGWAEVPGGHPIEYFDYLDSPTWRRVSGGARWIGTNEADLPWVVNNSGNIFKGLGWL